MRRLLILIGLGLLLFSCGKDNSRTSGEFRVELTSVGGSRARITVAAMNKQAYYSYAFVSRQESLFNASAEDIVREEIASMEDGYKYFEKIGIQGSFLDVYCYQGSRQFPISSLSPDMDYKFIVFQIHPKTHALIGQPVVTPFHTRPIPVRDLTFDVQMVGNTIQVTPSDHTLTYFWDYEDNDVIEDDYYFPQDYLYKLVEMYDEYGFMDSMLSRGPDQWDFAEDKWISPGEECTLVIAGCEDAEFTTWPMFLVFRYNGPGDIDILTPLTECSLDY